MQSDLQLAVSSSMQSSKQFAIQFLFVCSSRARRFSAQLSIGCLRRRFDENWVFSRCSFLSFRIRFIKFDINASPHRICRACPSSIGHRHATRKWPMLPVTRSKIGRVGLGKMRCVFFSPIFKKLSWNLSFTKWQSEGCAGFNGDVIEV